MVDTYSSLFYAVLCYALPGMLGERTEKCQRRGYDEEMMR